MTPEKKAKAFTSLRIVGERAQKILERARNNKTLPPKRKSLPISQDKATEDIVVQISVKSTVKATFAIIAIFAGAWIIFHMRDKLVLALLAVFIAVVIDPSVRKFQEYKVPRGIAVLIHYFIALFLLVFLLVSLIPIIATQLQQIAATLSTQVDLFLANPQVSIPLLSEELNVRLTSLSQTTLQNLSIHQFTDALQQFGQSLSTAAQGSVRYAAQIAGSVFAFFVNLIVVLVLAFFIQLEKEQIVRWLRGFLPQKYQAYIDVKFEAIHIKIAQWARGELLLCLSIFTLTFLALIILRMPYALTLAVLAGFCEFIPAMGPLIAAVPSVFIALTQEGFIWALVVAGIYYVIQWCENNLLVPLIMKRAVGLSPIAILFGMLIGVSFPETIHPVLGIMLAIPTTTIIAIFLNDWRANKD